MEWNRKISDNCRRSAFEKYGHSSKGQEPDSTLKLHNCPSPARKKMKTYCFKPQEKETSDSGVILDDSFEFSISTQTLIKNSKQSELKRSNVEENNLTTIVQHEFAKAELMHCDYLTKVSHTSSINTEVAKPNVFEHTEEKEVYDAFQNFMEKNLPEINNMSCFKHNTQSNNKEELKTIDKRKHFGEIQSMPASSSKANDVPLVCSQMSQFFGGTQVVQQIDKIINTDTAKLNVAKQSNQPEKKILKKLFQQKFNVEPDVKSKDDLCNDSQILNSAIDKQDIEMWFDRLETTICELGPKQDECLLMEKSTHKTPEKQKNIMESIRSPIDQNLDWGDDSVFANLTQTDYFSALKKKLLEHAVKFSHVPIPVSKPKVFPEFRSMGNFYGLPNRVIELMKLYRGIDKLYDWQDECLNLPAVKSRKNLVYALPTSGGKTLVAEILILREILCRNKNAILVLPYVAIVQEKVWALSPFALALGFLIEEYAGGKGIFPPRKRRRKNSVYIATIEKALGMVDSLIETDRLDEIGIVVVDELHLIGDKTRGSTLESVLTKLIYVGKNVQIIGMSATIGNLGEICDFLKADVYTHDFRPVELIEYVKCDGQISKINWKSTSSDHLLTFERKVDFNYSEENKKLDPDRLTGLVMEVIPEGSCLIFCSSKKSCENVTTLLCKVMFRSIREHKKVEKALLKEALKAESGNLCNILNFSIPFGVAYHHAGLTSEERMLIENGFREGVISVICCTSTLAAGVNLPAKRVILRQPYIGRDFINLSRYKQMVGRAGRAGFGETGESILICANQDLRKVKNLLLSPMDLSHSSIHEAKDLRHFLLSCISLRLATTREQLRTITRSSLLAVQEKTLNINVKKLTDDALRDLFRLQAVKIAGSEAPAAEVVMQQTAPTGVVASSTLGNLSSSESSKSGNTLVTLTNSTELMISNLGLAAIKGGLELSRAHLLFEDLRQAQTSLVLVDCLHLLYLVTPYDVADQMKISKPHYSSIYMQLGAQELQTAKILGINEACAIRMMTNQSVKNVPLRILNKFYVSLMLFDLWNEMPIYEVAEKYQVDRGVVQNLMTSAATFASNVVNFCTQMPEFWAFIHLLKGMGVRLQHCCGQELIALMELPNVKQSRARQLFNAGFKTLQSIAKADPNDLIQNIEYMSRKLASELIATSKLLLIEKVENLREEAKDVLEGIDVPNVFS